MSDKYFLKGLNLRYSSWTNRAVVLLERLDIPYSLEVHQLGDKEQWAKTKATLPAGTLPVLYVKDLPQPVHDSLAIAEFLHEEFPDKQVWPKDKGLRAYGRSIVAEMHSGFTSIRNEHPMNFCMKYVPAPKISDAVKKDITRILQIFDTARKYAKEVLGSEDEGYLLGKFSAADSFYWPLLTRVHTYSIDTSAATPEAKAYIDTMWADRKIKAIAKRQLAELQEDKYTVHAYDNVCEGSEMKQWDIEGYINA